MPLILDSSVALAWIYTDELTPATLSLSKSIGETGAWAPSIWPLEIANSLFFSIRRGRINHAFRDQAILDLTRLGISIDDVTHEHAWTTTLALSDRCKLTTYDACYLELAHRRSLPLATLDNELHAAAKKVGVRVLA